MATDVLDLVSSMKANGTRFVLATVVRTVSVTAAKAGAKAVIEEDGTITGGWIGGGCARGAVLRAARSALADGTPRLVSIQPKDLLRTIGVTAGEARDGIEFASNSCPSQGTMDIFVEPILPRPELVILGESPVALSLAELGRGLNFHVTLCAPPGDLGEGPAVDCRIDGFSPPDCTAPRFIVVATQGKGDSAAIEAALGVDAAYVAFVGSRRKAESLRENMRARGVSGERLEGFKAPAGLDLGAITPEEIALSVLAEITLLRRHGQRAALALKGE